MEACATAHHWARELAKLGHTVRLMPASYVKAYVKKSQEQCGRICEDVTRPSMRFVPAKTIDQQEALTLHRSRDLLIRKRTQRIYALRALADGTEERLPGPMQEPTKSGSLVEISRAPRSFPIP